MPFIDATGQVLLRALPRLAQARTLLLALGRAVVPAALVLLIGSGLALFVHLTSWSSLRADTLRALHDLGALMLGAAAGYGGGRYAVGWVWRRLSGVPPRRGLRRLGFPGWSAVGEWGWWMAIGVLFVSGLARYASGAWGWIPPSWGDPAGWVTLHALVSPLAYGLGVLALYRGLRRILPAFRDYLLRHY